jgi:hypothetical protein
MRYQVILNSSYGSDGQNNEKFANIRFLSKAKALRATANCNFVSSTKISDDLYLVEKEPVSAACEKPLHTAFATLSNAKYWFVSFVYNFMYKCMDTERFHFVVCDTDSHMWAVSGTGVRDKVIDKILGNLSEKNMTKIKEKIVPHFEEIIKDREFYEKNYSLFFPKKKTLMNLEYEHCCRNLLALAPKKSRKTGVITKAVVPKNQACLPFVYGITADF